MGCREHKRSLPQSACAGARTSAGNASPSSSSQRTRRVRPSQLVSSTASGTSLARSDENVITLFAELSRDLVPDTFIRARHQRNLVLRHTIFLRSSLCQKSRTSNLCHRLRFGCDCRSFDSGPADRARNKKACPRWIEDRLPKRNERLLAGFGLVLIVTV